MLHIINYAGIKMVNDPAKLQLSFEQDGKVREFCEIPFLRFKNDKFSRFNNAKCESEEYVTGVARGVRARYFDFDLDGAPAGFEKLVAVTETEITFDGWVRMSIYFENEPEDGLRAVYYPQPLKFGAPKGTGYTVLPRMQGVILPAEFEETINGGHYEGLIFDRNAYMPIYGQVTDTKDFGAGFGYTAIFDTPYDARYMFDHQPNGDTLITPVFWSSLGRIGYKRTMLYKFDSNCDYTKIAKTYRGYLKERGMLLTLREKIQRNPNVAKLIGTPVIHSIIAVHICSVSHYYDKDHPENNDYHVTFAERAQQLRELKANGVEKAYLHFDGWGKHGYDNLHPSPFPPHEAAGGAEGMKELADTANELGYIFGIHDQYRDYYYDGPDFDIGNAVENEDGSHFLSSFWYGGKHTFLCAKFAPEYVRRNYNQFNALGIDIKGSYLDVFSVVELDECFNPRHRMTREECSDLRNQCFALLNDRGIITSSEETMDCSVSAIALCHHAPHYTNGFDADRHHVGIPIPFFNLVWHDCVVTPYAAIGGTWGIPIGYDPLGLAYINGGTVYFDIGGNTKEEYEKLYPVLDLHSKIADRELLRHEIVDGNPLHQRSIFDSPDGEITVDVDFTIDENAKIKVY